ncbi:GNAT family N-acetyltransferase [Methyloversatilis sp.]|uniref:GNAT family N-acetyltransferase n=1 Tax=Methyloversatilis sp. TaxID=2569862 RepID=UPI0035B14AB7
MLRVELGDWSAMAPSLELIRREVFVIEQRVPEEMEWDADDATGVHALALIDECPVGCGRLLPDAHIGRIAVRAPFRLRGVGRAVMLALLDAARRRSMPHVELHAQTHALRFYERLGFVAEGPVFDEAGLPHRRMSRVLAS